MTGRNICFKQYGKLSPNYHFYPFLSGALISNNFSLKVTGTLPGKTTAILTLASILNGVHL